MTRNEAHYVADNRHWFTYETYLLALDILEDKVNEEIKIGDRIKLEHIKSNSFIDSVVVDFDEGGNYPSVTLPGDVTIYWGDGWERVG